MNTYHKAWVAIATLYLAITANAGEEAKTVVENAGLKSDGELVQTHQTNTLEAKAEPEQQRRVLMRLKNSAILKDSIPVTNQSSVKEGASGIRSHTKDDAAYRPKPILIPSYSTGGSADDGASDANESSGELMSSNRKK